MSGYGVIILKDSFFGDQLKCWKITEEAVMKKSPD